MKKPMHLRKQTLRVRAETLRSLATELHAVAGGRPHYTDILSDNCTEATACETSLVCTVGC